MPLPADAARRSLQTLTEQLGRADRERLAKLPDLIRPDRRIPLGDALDRLYPGQSRTAALTALRQMRGRLAVAAQEAGIDFALEADTETRTAPAQRHCWFAGDDQAAEATARMIAAETAGVARSPQDAMEIGRRVRYFVSYAHDDAVPKTDLLKRLQHRFDAARAFRFERWQDHDIVLGSKWHDEIQAAIQACDFGLLLVSPAFLASRYITGNELPQFIGTDGQPGKHMVPVALKPILFDGSMNLHGLQHRQIFHDAEDKAFQQRTTDPTRDAFATQLFSKIVRMLGGIASPPPEPPRDSFRWQRDLLEHNLADDHHVPAHAHPWTLDKLDTDPPAEQRREALDMLTEWAADPTGQPCCALLGETGMGKTTTCKAFTHRLLDRRETDKTVPLPIYLDLRLLGEDAVSLPRVETVIETVLRRSWQGGRSEPPPDAAAVQRLVREEGAIIIFDGLDEVLVHLSPRAGQQFTRELLSILPPAFWPRRRRPGMPGRPGRILLTCRTHYFRSVRDQNTHLTAEDRDDVRDTDYRVLILLPFTDDQIRAYLTASLPGADIARVLETIRSVHNLPELAARPYTLSLITRHLPQIERWKLEGRRVTGVDLYRHMVLSWLERDTGKHELEADHKQQIMEQVAARLHRAGSRVWTARQMEDWLAEFLDATPAVGRHYQHKDREVLKKDLRTATFLVGGGQADFRFAHTSLQEFFLAGFLLRALRESRAADWDMPRPSNETLDFLGQMLLGADDDTALATLRAMRGRYQAGVSELAFFYSLFAGHAGYPAPAPAGFMLDGADLRGWVIGDGVSVGVPGDPPPRPSLTRGAAGPLVNLRQASFRGARLRGVVFHRVDLEGADFTGANMPCAELNTGRARGARFAGAALMGVVFRAVDLTGAAFAGAALHRTQFLRCDLARVTGLDAAPPAVLLAACDPAGLTAPVAQQKSRLATLGGHSGGVTGCAFAPDGTRILSASWDNTLRLWDAATGEALMTLQGHTNPVTACAFAPDGTRILSASGDNTLRLWDAATGEAVGFRVALLGDGHFASLTADGQRIIQVSPEAWRDLGWLVPDPTGALTRYPVELFGPLPEYAG